MSLLLLLAEGGAGGGTDTVTTTSGASVTTRGFILIRPKTIDDAALTSSNISEAAPAAWSNVTTYSQSDRIGVTTGTSVQVYKSLADSNLNNDPATSPAWWVVDGTTYVAWSSLTTYGAADTVIDALAHRVYESLAAANLNNALTDPAWWLDIGPTNKWAMFDSYNGTTTAHPYQIDNTMQVSGRADSLALLNLVNAVSARIVVNSADMVTVYDQTFSLISTDGIDDWWNYFFDDVEKKATLLVTDLPNYADPTIRVTIEGNGESNVECGILSIGSAKSLGRTLYDGAQVGIDDYSRVTFDEFGNSTLIKRSYAKRGDFKMRIAKAEVDNIQLVLAAYRATPAVWSASADYGSTTIFGIFQSFQIEIDYPNESLVSISIKGLA